jgi:hypothetical protein
LSRQEFIQTFGGYQGIKPPAQAVFFGVHVISSRSVYLAAVLASISRVTA